MPAGRPKHFTISQLLIAHPELQRELARLLANSQLDGKRKMGATARFHDLRRFGSALFTILNTIAEDVRDTITLDHGLTLNNSWKVSALANLSKEMYPLARDAWGIPALAAVKPGLCKTSPQDWRRSLVEVETQLQDVNNGAHFDEREPTESSQPETESPA